MNKTKAYYPSNEPFGFWRDVPGTEGRYRMSKDGELRRVWNSGKVTDIKPQPSSKNRRRKVYRLTLNGKRKEYLAHKLMCITWLGEVPKGMVLYHKNGAIEDNHLANLGFITRKELGKKTAHKSHGQPVFKIDAAGEPIDIYRSAREAARKNYMSYQTVMDRCNLKVWKEFALSDFSFRWAKDIEGE